MRVSPLSNVDHHIANLGSFVRGTSGQFDIRTNFEVSDISTQRSQVAFEGPLGDTGFDYRLGLSSYTGDGRLKNLCEPDGMKPDETIVAPQLRWKNDR